MTNKQAAPKDTSAKTGTKNASKHKINSTKKPETIEHTPKPGWSIGAVFWGLLLVTVGGLLLFGNLGLVTVSWSELLRLWPLVIVAAGFSVLATTHWLWKIVSLLFIIGAILSVIYVGTGMYTADTKELSGQSASIAKAKRVTRAELTIHAGASNVAIRSNDMADVVKAELMSNNLLLQQDSVREGSLQKIVLSTSTQRNFWLEPPQSTWDIVLTERLPIGLTIDAGLAKIDADLSQLQLTSLLVKAGASSSIITLGDKENNLEVDIESGVSSMTLRIPRNTGVAMNLGGGLTSRDFEDLNEVAKGEYRSDNYDSATNRITINADAGLASFKVERY